MVSHMASSRSVSGNYASVRIATSINAGNSALDDSRNINLGNTEQVCHLLPPEVAEVGGPNSLMRAGTRGHATFSGHRMAGAARVTACCPVMSSLAALPMVERENHLRANDKRPTVPRQRVLRNYFGVSLTREEQL
jgi:hypothetical protein